MVLVALLVAAALLVGSKFGAPESPDDESAAAGFLRDMQVHHAQAVEMSMLVRDRSTDPAIRRLAYDIALGQQQQSGQMFALLRSWGLSQVAAPGRTMEWTNGMSGMSGSSADGTAEMTDARVESTASRSMPGMAEPAQMRRLRASDGVPAERLFLRLMIDHHRAGVAMADAAVGLVENTQTKRLAQSMRESQRSEIAVLQDLLDRR
ncbi:DUF305 domain-containing protein [Nocardioides marmoraquaticus]